MNACPSSAVPGTATNTIPGVTLRLSSVSPATSGSGDEWTPINSDSRIAATSLVHSSFHRRTGGQEKSIIGLHCCGSCDRDEQPRTSQTPVQPHQASQQRRMKKYLLISFFHRRTAGQQKINYWSPWLRLL